MMLRHRKIMRECKRRREGKRKERERRWYRLGTPKGLRPPRSSSLFFLFFLLISDTAAGFNLRPGLGLPRVGPQTHQTKISAPAPAAPHARVRWSLLVRSVGRSGGRSVGRPSGWTLGRSSDRNLFPTSSLGLKPGSRQRLLFVRLISPSENRS